MAKLLLVLACLLAGNALHAAEPTPPATPTQAGESAEPADTIVIPAGISFRPPEQLDLTHQLIPDVDENEKVIAGWDGEKLLYVIQVGKLPPNNNLAQKYLRELVSAVGSSLGKKVEAGKMVAYPAQGGLTVSAMSMRYLSSPGGPYVFSIVYHITDGQQSFMATATATSDKNAERVSADVAALMKSAHLSAVDPAVLQRIEALLGVWNYDETLPSGQVVKGTFELKADQTFTTSVTVGSVTALSGSGTWGLTGNTLYWEYLKSMPSLPEDRRRDADEVMKVSADALELKSELSGKTRVYKKAAKAPL